MEKREGKTIRNERLWLLVPGVAAIVAVNAVLAAVLTGQVTDRLLAREGEVKQQFLTSILAAEAPADQLFAQPAPSPALAAFSSHVRDQPGTVRANIYSPDGFIRYSTEANLVGLHFGANKGLEKAFGGALTTTLESQRDDSKAEHLALNQLDGLELVEAYVPVKDPGGKVAAVVEFYRKDPALSQLRASLQRSIWLAAAASSVIMAGVLVIGLRRRPSV